MKITVENMPLADAQASSFLEIAAVDPQFRREHPTAQINISLSNAVRSLDRNGDGEFDATDFQAITGVPYWRAPTLWNGYQLAVRSFHCEPTPVATPVDPSLGDRLMGQMAFRNIRR